MTRTLAFCALAALLASCTRYHSRAQGPFAKPEKESAAAAAAKPLANQSSLDLRQGGPVTAPGADDRAVVPPPGGAPAVAASPPPDLDEPGAFPPLRRRTEPKSGSMPPPPAPKGTAPDKAGPPSAAAKGLTELKTLLATAGAAWKAIDTFEGVLTRREINPQGTATSEVVLFQFRREPMAVYTRTVGEISKGREVLYNPSKYKDELHIVPGAGDPTNPFKKGPLTFSPDSPLVKQRARHSIRDAGFGRHFAKLTELVAKVEGGKLPADALAFQAAAKRDEFPDPLAAVTHTMRPGDDPLFPNGGTRTYYFDTRAKSPSYGLPVLIVATEASGKEAEYYLFEKIKQPANLTDADFNPDRLGKR